MSEGSVDVRNLKLVKRSASSYPTAPLSLPRIYWLTVVLVSVVGTQITTPVLILIDTAPLDIVLPVAHG